MKLAPMICAIMLTACAALTATTRPGALATESGSGEVGGARPSPTIKTISLDTLIETNRTGLIHLYEQHERDDTNIVVKEYPAWLAGSLLRALINEGPAIRRLLRDLRGVSEIDKFKGIVARHLTRMRAKITLLEGDIRTTQSEIDAERRAIAASRQGILPNPSATSPRLDALVQSHEEQRIRLERAQSAIGFVDLLPIYVLPRPAE